MPTQPTQSSYRKLPGSIGLWIFILSDLMLFGLYFSLFAYDRSADSVSFYQGQASLNNSIGLVNTLLLLTGSWAVVMGTRVERHNRRAANYLSFAAASGMIFLLFKAIEYSHLFSAGHHLTESHFFIWYFFLTGYHAIHVLAGSFFLQFIARKLRREETVAEELSESAGCYWHLVDLLWIGIFSLAYLL